jgi:hypothetical protein
LLLRWLRRRGRGVLRGARLSRQSSECAWRRRGGRSGGRDGGAGFAGSSRRQLG